MCLDHTYRPPRVLRLLAIALVALTSMLALNAVRASSASADIGYPYEFMPTIDGYQGYQGQTTCHSQEMPGVVDFRNYLSFWFPVPEKGQILRRCDAPGRSEHKEGRALDYFANARTNPATTIRILGNVLGTDKYGNAHALGRRFGLMYIISNGRQFRFYRPNEGWQPYTPPGDSRACTPNTDSRVTPCHIDHIHFSFSWAGALKQTSWWTTTQVLKTGCGSRVRAWHFNSAFGPLIQIYAIRDQYGQLFDTQSEIRNSYWRVRAGGQQYFANQPVSPLLNPKPQAVLPLFSGGQCLVNL